MELREFFGAVKFEQVSELAKAIAESGREPELNATLRESAAVMPIVKQVTAAISEREAAGDIDQKRALQGQLFLLMAVYRLAEDMGYKW
jgi:hypothetical protein